VKELFNVLCELSLREDAIKAYLEFVCTQLINSKSSSTVSDKDAFREEHQVLNQAAFMILQSEISLTGGKGGRIVDVFGSDLWYSISVDLLNRYFRVEYKRFIQETLDTEGKSK
jgi:hypothetical protein